MFYKKKGIPEEGEIVLCTVKKILYHSVFVSIDEYETLEGMLHISEISPGRIRNIRDYVKEGKQIACKVLNIDHRKGHIDVSLRRVNEAQKANKLRESKNEARAEKILEAIGKESGKDLPVMYKDVGDKLIEEYGSLNEAFENLIMDEDLIDKLKLNKKSIDLFKKILNEKIKKPEVEIKEHLELHSERENGVEIIKKILTSLQKGDIKISYVSAPKYSIVVKASDYKTAEGILENLNKDAQKMAEDNGVLLNISREK